MKAFTKFCLICSAVLLILGIAGIGVGFSMGLKPDQLLNLAHFPDTPIPEKPDSIEEIEDSTDPEESSHPDIAPLSGSNSSGADEYYEFDGRIDTLDFELALCDLKVFVYDKDYIALEASNTGNTFQCIQDGHTLRLEDDRNWLLFQNSMSQALSLKLYLPGRTLANADIRLGTGSLTLDRLSADTMNIKCGTGDLTAGELSGEDIGFQLGVGDLDIDTISASKSCTIESGTGDITLNKYDGANLDLNCAVGDISVTAAGKPEQYNYELNCVAGEIHLHHPDSESHHEKEDDTVGCLINVDNDAERELFMQCGMGDMKLNFTEED